MESVTFSLCTECEHCPEIMIDAEGVRIGEPGNLVRLTRAEWNRLVALVRQGALGELT